MTESFRLSAWRSMADFTAPEVELRLDKVVSQRLHTYTMAVIEAVKDAVGLGDGSSQREWPELADGLRTDSTKVTLKRAED